MHHPEIRSVYHLCLTQGSCWRVYAEIVQHLLDGLLFLFGLRCKVLLELLLKLLDEVGMLDIDVLGLLLEDWGGAFLQEGDVGGDDILHKWVCTSFWNMISCLISFLMEKPARDFLELKTSFSTKDS